MTAPEGLGRRLRSGGSVLLVRQLLGGALGFAATMAVTSLIGPAPFGEYAAALALAVPVILVGQWGVVVGIVRQPDPPSPEALAEAASVVLGATVALALIAALVAGLTLTGPLAGALGQALTMLAIAPFATAGTVQLAILERDLAYHRIAAGEFAGQIAAILVSVSLAFIGLGPWAPALGWCASRSP
jgi:O-antigen/teichoic acid export membrane protein